MARTWYVNDKTGVIMGMTDSEGVPPPAGQRAVAIPADATGIPRRGIQAGGHWDAETQVYTQSEQSLHWEREHAARAAQPETVDPEWAHQMALYQAAQEA